MLAAQGRTFPLDLRAPAERTNGLLKNVKYQRVSLDGVLQEASLDAGTADVGAVEVGDTLSLTLFANVSIDLVLKEKMPSPLGGDAFIAEASGYEGIKTAVVLCTADGLAIDIQDYRNKKVYKVISSSTGVKVQEIEVTGSGRCGCDVKGQFAPDDALCGAPNKVSANVIAPADTCVDILVAFDANAAAWANSNGGGMTNFAQTAVQKMNIALANTGLDSNFRFRLVGVTKLSVSASDVKEGLEAIRDNRAGWNAVRTARDAVGADIVTTLIDTGSAYGVNGIGTALSSGMSPSSFAESAYNVCSVRAVAISNTMTHECGHNMGAGHSDIQMTQPGPLLYPYSSGYYFTVDGAPYCTIMAYDSENPSGEFSTQVPFFSSPSYAYEGTTVGDSSHDNTRTLANTYAAAANWRAQKVDTSYDVNFSPAPGSLIDGSISVTLATGKSGTSIRYTTDGSVPTLSSPLYSSPITITRTTTIKAISVTNGKASMPFAASYYMRNDIGYAMGLTDLKWSMSVPSTSTLGAQTEETLDGVALGATVKKGDVCTFSTTIVGPATITWRTFFEGDYFVRVTCDGSEVFSEFTSGYPFDWSSEPLAADIPSGSHKVQFSLGASLSSGYEFFYDVSSYWFDEFQVHYVQKPTFKPATTDHASTAATFTGEQMVTLQPPNADCMIYYTLDGSDPNGNGALLYEGPFFINASTLVKAITVQPGKGTSGIASGLYMSHRAVRAGEWTLWGEGAYEAAKSGRAIAELEWDLTWCAWSQDLEPIITGDAFTTWAAANDIYLLARSWGAMLQGTGGRFWDMGYYGETDLYYELLNMYYPTFLLVSGNGTCLGAMLARNDDEHSVNGIYYRDTPESLIASFASILGVAAPLAAPIPSVKDANGKTYPFSVTLSNPNGTGTIYYTLDGTVPTREKGILYTGAITIPALGTTLKAVVWPSNTGAVSGVPLAITYQPLGAEIGTDGVTWQNDALRPWKVTKTSSGVKFDGFKNKSLTSGSVSSTIKATVNGPGLVKFKYSMVSRGGDTDFLFKVNGGEVEVPTYAYNKDITYRIESTGATELSWTYVYGYLDADDQYYCEFKDFEWIPFAAPKSVSGLTASQGTYDYGVLLRWQTSSHAKTYAIYRSETNVSSGARLIGTTANSQYWDTSAMSGLSYWYWVKAVNDYGESAFSSGVSGRKKGGSAPQFKVTFGKNGGTGGDNYVTATYGAAMPTPRTAPKLSGWTFAGYWDTLALDEKGNPKGKQYYDANMKSVRAWDKTSATTLWAKWTNKVTFGKNGGTGGDSYVTCTKGQPMPKRTMPTKSGYFFDGYWTTTGAGGVKYYNADGTSAHAWDKGGSVTLWAKWVAETKVKVTFGKNGGTGGDDYVTATTGKAMPTPRTAPKLSGWTFGGYWDTLACDEKGNPKGKQYYNAKMESVRAWDKTSATTLWAKWTNKVTLGKNGGTGGDSYVTCTKGQPMPRRTMPTKSGYVFDGYWTTTGAGGVKYYNADGTSAHAWDKGGSVTLWAKWVAETKVKVTFGKNGGTGGDDYVTATTGKAMPTPRTAPTLKGWTFGGYWDTLACDEKGNPKGKQYYNAKMESVRAWDKTAATTLWAKWTVKVTLGKNGGTGGDSTVTVIKGQPFPKRTMPKKSGFKFGGYFVSSSKKTGQCYNPDGTGTSSMKWSTGGTPTIWALWTKAAGCVELPASPAAPASLTSGLYSGVLADGTGAFWLVLDASEDGSAHTAFLYIALEDGSLTAECTAEEVDGILLLTTEDGETFAVDPAVGKLEM